MTFSERIKNIKIKITEGFLLALLPGLGYISAYCFETGSLSFYGIGEEFANISLNSVIASMLGILGAFFLATILIEICYPFIIKFNPTNPIHRRLIFSSVLFLAGLLVLLISNSIFISLIIMPLILLIILTLFAKPMFQYRK